jgi:hypothetical protein
MPYIFRFVSRLPAFLQPRRAFAEGPQIAVFRFFMPRSGILAFWHFGILAFWHFGILAFWHFRIFAFRASAHNAFF